MIENNRIIIIDDDKEDLDQLRQVFYEHGIGCKGFVYDGLEFPEQPLKGVRFAFFDINLNPSGDINSTLKDAISHYIAEEEQYILIFWSKNTEVIDGFVKFVNRTDDNFKRRLKPILLSFIDKTQFMGRGKELTDKVNEILASNLAKCIVGFDESIELAARETLNRILKIIPFTGEWGCQEENDKMCQDVFSKIAETTYGLEQARINPDAAIKESVIPIFRHILLNDDATFWKEYLAPLSNSNNNISFPDDFSVERLNSILHIDKSDIAKKAICSRGAVSTFASRGSNFGELFGVNYCDWFAQTFPGLTRQDRGQAKPIAIEFSAACDFSQNKKRTNKYILGALLPSNCLCRIDKAHLGDYTFLLSFDFEFEDKVWTIGLNLNYTFTLPPNSSVLEHPSFVLTKETMDMLGHKYASHLSRIGITSFRKEDGVSLPTRKTTSRNSDNICAKLGKCAKDGKKCMETDGTSVWEVGEG